MSAQNQKNSIKKLVSLMGLASASVFLAFPALALNNSNSSSFDGSLNNRTRRVESTGRSRQLLAQNSSGTGGMGTGQTGTGGTGTGQTGTGGTGTGGMGTGQNGTGGTGTGGINSSNGQPNGQQDEFTQYMRAGYAATDQRDYQTALTNFQRALQVRPRNPYATRAIRNVRGYMQRGTTTTPTNQGRF